MQGLLQARDLLGEHGREGGMKRNRPRQRRLIGAPPSEPRAALRGS
jgi:hypothetical protein